MLDNKIVRSHGTTGLKNSTKGKNVPNIIIEFTLLLDILTSSPGTRLHEQIRFQVLTADFRPRSWEGYCLRLKR
ncbi:MAG: hypothetical protein ACM3SP_03985 [Chloroflexota bacterium]